MTELARYRSTLSLACSRVLLAIDNGLRNGSEEIRTEMLTLVAILRSSLEVKPVSCMQVRKWHSAPLELMSSYPSFVVLYIEGVHLHYIPQPYNVTNTLIGRASGL
jgi:hypothetical protein